jgi:K+-sensing histidine kinase KdpD
LSSLVAMPSPAPTAGGELLRLVVESVPAGVAILGGPELRLLLANAAFRRCLGDPERDPAGRTVEELWPDDEGLRVRALVERAARGEEPRGERIEPAGSGERSFVLQATALPTRLDGGAQVLLASWDTTELDAARAAAERARERAELLAAMAAELSAGEGLDEVFRTALERGAALLGAQDGAVFLAEADGRHLRGSFELLPRGRAGATLDLAEHPHTLAALTRGAPVAFTRAEARQGEAAWLDRIGLSSAVAAPLVVEGRREGVLYLDFARPEGPRSDEDLEFGAAIASQCALAITRARGHEDERRARARAEAAEGAMRRAAQRLALVADVTAALSSAHLRDDVAAVIYEKGLRAFGARRAALYVPDAGGGLRLEQEFGRAAGVPEAVPRLPPGGRAPALEAARRREPLWLESPDELRQLDPGASGAPDAEGQGAWAGLPLEVDGRLVGVLGLAFGTARRFEPDERAILASLAQKFAQALDRARLYEENRTQVELAERARARAEMLAGLAADLNRGTDLAAVADIALARGVELLGGEDGSVYLLGDDGRALRGVAELRPLGRAGLELRVADLPHVVEALSRRGPVHFARDEAEGAERPWCERHGLRGMLVLPMLDGDRQLGVLFVGRYRLAPAPSPDDLAFGEALAAHCALAITRAQSYEAERAARTRAEAAEGVTRRIAHRLAVTQELTAALSSAHTQADVAEAIFASGLAAVGARAGAVYVSRPGGAPRLLRASADGAPDGGRLDGPVLAAFGEREVTWSAATGEAARATVPLVVDERVVGVLDLEFPAERGIDLEDRAFLGALAQKFAQALERTWLYEAERAARTEAERVGKLQEQLIAVVGHDLRTPLSAISMGASVLFRRGGLDEKQAQTLGRMAASAARMAGIIRDLLDFSRARQGGGIPIQRAPADLGEIASRAILELQAAHPGCEVALRVHADARVEGDEPRLLQVVSNLIGNAIQHGAPESRVDVRVDGAAPDALVLSVHNDGEPIPAELLPTVFEPFKRGERRGGGEGGSVGLGLFIVREIVRAHGGDVEVRSVAGEGTTFTVRLPR